MIEIHSRKNKWADISAIKEIFIIEFPAVEVGCRTE
jgi:hypothetical protein